MNTCINHFDIIGDDIVRLIYLEMLLPYEMYKCLGINKMLYHVLLRSNLPFYNNIIPVCVGLIKDINVIFDYKYFKLNYYEMFDYQWELLMLSFGNFTNLTINQRNQLKYYLVNQSQIIGYHFSKVNRKESNLIDNCLKNFQYLSLDKINEMNSLTELDRYRLKLVFIMSNIKELYLQQNYNGFGYKGCQFVGDIIRSKYSMLETIDISDNHIDDKGLSVINNAFKERFFKYGIYNINELCFSGNYSISNDGLNSLLNNIGKYCHKLKSLHLSNMNLNNNSCMLILNFFRKYKHVGLGLNVIHLTRNIDINDIGVDTLNKIFQENLIKEKKPHFRIYIDACNIKHYKQTWDTRITYIFNNQSRSIQT